MTRDVLQVEVRYAPASPSASDPLAQRAHIEFHLMVASDLSLERLGAIVSAVMAASLAE